LRPCGAPGSLIPSFEAALQVHLQITNLLCILRVVLYPDLSSLHLSFSLQARMLRPRPRPYQTSGSSTGSSSTGSSLQTPHLVNNLGFTTLYAPADQKPVADIVFVHGLQGHPGRTWTYKGKITVPVPVSPSKSSSNSIRRFSFSWNRSEPKLSRTVTKATKVFWPSDLLPLDLPNVRILTYGYDSKVTKWFCGAANQMNLEDHGTSFLNSLEAQRRNCRGRPIIFVAHSLGGLVVEEAICRSRAEHFFGHLRDVHDSLHSVIFLGTPHKGSKDAESGLLLTTVANAALFDTNDSLLRGLNPKTGTEKLNKLNSEFCDILAKKRVKVMSFRESMGKAGTSLLNGKVRVNFNRDYEGHLLTTER
jgi:hypothetical protein